MLSSPAPPNPFDSVEQAARKNSVLASFEMKIQSYALILLIGLVVMVILLVSTWVIISTQTPDYKLGNTVVQVVAPAPSSEVKGVTDVKVNMLTTLSPKILKAFVKAGDGSSNELTVNQVGKGVIQLAGSWDTQTATGDVMEVSLYNVAQSDHPILVGYTQIPVTILH